MGTLQYAAVHLHTPLFVVLGHEGCGAVQAALARKDHGARERERIDLLLSSIVPGLEALDGDPSSPARLTSAVEANVRWSMRQLRETPEGQARMAEGILKLVGAVYELQPAASGSCPTLDADQNWTLSGPGPGRSRVCARLIQPTAARSGRACS